MTLFRSTARDAARLGASTDWMWGGVGLTMASASACFAAYMIATAPAEVTGSGSKDWNIFVRWDRRGPLLAGAERRPPVRTAEGGTAAGLDPEPTGSIPAQDGAGAAEAGAPAPSTPSTPVPGFILHDVIGDKALVEHRKTLSLVKTGSVLDGAGEVVAIERRGDGWVVRTTAGVIASGS